MLGICPATGEVTEGAVLPDVMRKSLLKSRFSTKAEARELLDRFWKKRLAHRADRELIDLGRERYLRIGLGQLTGAPVDDAAGNAWWKIRMGQELMPDPEHHLMAMTTKAPDSVYRHFALGLRHVSGTRLTRDFVLEFRAPWPNDRKPRFREALNFDRSLQLSLDRPSFPEWLYTQTHFRGVDVHIRFLEIAREHRLLLEELAREREGSNYGSFRAFNNNCSSPAFDIFQALLPLDERFGPPRFIADVPKRVGRRAAKRFLQVGEAHIPSRTDQLQRTPTRKSDYHRPPDPSLVPGIRQIGAIPSLRRTR